MPSAPAPAPRESVPISACIIAKDEADRIRPCLESVAFCDEILVLDSGSSDETVAICRAAGARVIETDWPGWVAQKNRAVEAAAHDWILSLDADERVDADLRAAIERLCAGALVDDASSRAWEVARKVRYLGQWLKHGGWYPEWRTRLFHREHARWGGMDPHDHIVADGPVGRIPVGNLEHYTYRSLEDQIAQINRHTTAAANELLERGARGRVWPIVLRPPFHFFRHYILRLGFLDGRAGFVMSGMRAYYVFLKYAKVWDGARRTASDPSDEGTSA